MNARVRWTQVCLNAFFRTRHLTYKPLALDGELGPMTERNIRHARYYLGLGASLERQSSAITDELIRTLKNPRRVVLGWAPERHERRLLVAGRRQRQRKAQVKAANRADEGTKAIAAASRMVGKTETGNNDAGWLRAMERDLPHHRLDWMIPGNPYCGFGVVWAWWVGAGVVLPDGAVYTPNICPWGGQKIGNAKFTRVAPENAKPGALVVFNFGSGGAKHVGLARGPMRGGVIPTVEFNTSPDSGGSQANGGGVWKRTRSRGLILCVLNVEKVAA